MTARSHRLPTIIATGVLLAGLSISLQTLAGPPLMQRIHEIDPDIRKWATVVRVTGPTDQPEFTWHHYRHSADAVDFWPASTIKLYTVIAALERLNELGMSEHSTLIFERFSEDDGAWVLDTARTTTEMISEIFRRSSNEDYTLLLRFLGIDDINTQFLIPERGFPHSALMRDYVTYRPVVYDNNEPQRITILDRQGAPQHIREHIWSGVSYAKQRGATALSESTGNCTSTRELADCLRRIMFHEVIPSTERFHLTRDQLDLVRYGGDGLTGLENKLAGAYAWTDSGEEVFPNARFFHKAGMISTYTLDAAYLEDAGSGTRLILALGAQSGKADTVRAMAKAAYQWARETGPEIQPHRP